MSDAHQTENERDTLATPSVSDSPKDTKLAITRRQVLRRGAAVAGGVTAAAYVKPSMQSLGISSAFAQHAPGAPPSPPGGPPSPPGGPPSPPPPPSGGLQGCTPGFWQGGNGADLWDTIPDPQWAGANAQPFAHDTLFASYFTSHPTIANNTMYDTMFEQVDRGATDDPVLKASRDLVAAALNISWGLNMGVTLAQLKQEWTDAVTANTDAAFEAFHTKWDALNNKHNNELCA